MARPSSDSLSADQARRLAVAAQGLDRPRPAGRVDRRHLRGLFERINVVQLDAVNVLVRSQELPLWARLGAHPRSMLADAIDRGDLFEYWAHMAAVVPAADHRLYRWRMEQAHVWHRVDELYARRPGYVDEVLARIRDDGPIVAGELGQRTAPKQPWWDWDDGKIAVEHLFFKGRLAVRRRRRDFARVYDLPERILPPEVLDAPTPSEHEARRELLMRAARALGVATLYDLADYHRQRQATCRPLVAELVEEGRLREVAVEGWSKPAYLDAAATIPRRDPVGVALLSPFDSLVWNRERNERLFDFHYRIEIYTPAAKRVYGYYVLPLLVDGSIVGRVDLKAHRAAEALRVQAAHVEDGADPREVAGRLVPELRAMADWLGLEGVEATGAGSLGPALFAVSGVGRADGSGPA